MEKLQILNLEMLAKLFSSLYPAKVLAATGSKPLMPQGVEHTRYTIAQSATDLREMFKQLDLRDVCLGGVAFGWHGDQGLPGAAAVDRPVSAADLRLRQRPSDARRDRPLDGLAAAAGAALRAAGRLQPLLGKPRRLQRRAVRLRGEALR